MRQGYSLTELVAVLVIIGILAGIAAPRAARTLDKVAVEQAARQIAAAHHRARFAAILRNRVTVLTITPDSCIIQPRNDTTTLWRDAGPSANGVALRSPGRVVMFSPVGLAMGASNATYTLTRGQARRSVIVSRLGRVRITS